MKRRTWKAKVASKHLRWAYFLRCHQWCDANSSLCPPQCQNEILLEDLPKPSSLPPPKKYGNPGGNSVAEKKNDALYPLAIWHGNEESLKDLKLKNWGGGRFCHVKSLEGSKQRKNGQIELSQPGRSVVLELWNCNDQWVLRPIPSSPTKAANGSVSTTAGDVRGVQDQEPYDCQKGPNHANKPWGEGCQCSQNWKCSIFTQVCNIYFQLFLVYFSV